MSRTFKLVSFLFFTVILCVSFLAFSDSSPTLALPEQVVIRGRQERGSPGRNAVLESAPVKLRRAGVIASVEGGRAGFWITGPRRITFDSAGEAIGTELPAGTYQVYPNLPRDADTATVAVTVTLQP